MEEQASMWSGPMGKTHTSSTPTGKLSTNHRAEMEAMQEAATILVNDPNTYNSKVVILTDAESVLKSVQNPKTANMNGLINVLMALTMSAQEVTLQWIPGHCDIFGNEVADELAKEGSSAEQLDIGPSYEEAKTLIRASIQDRWHKSHPNFNSRDAIYKLERSDQVIIFRLRTGHNRLNHHMHTRFRLGQTPGCPCGARDQDARHILQDCLLLSNLRDKTWPQRQSLRVKLHGAQPELERTAEFIRAAGAEV